MTTSIPRCTARVAAEGDSALVVRVDEDRVIRQAFAGRPATAAMHACGENVREVAVWYAPGF